MISELINIFESIFRRLYFEYPKDAAAYYATLITREFPSTMKCISLVADSTYPLLLRGRMELLEKGYVAKVLNLDDETIPTKKGELYLPVNPALIWQELQIEQAQAFGEEEIKHRDELIKEIGISYSQNFKDSSISIFGKNITFYYSGRWFLYTLLDSLNQNHHLDMMVGQLGSFREPYTAFYRRMFDGCGGLRLRILYNLPKDRASSEEQDNMQKSLEALEKLKKNYFNNIEFKASKVQHATSRRIILSHGDGQPYMAIDARKLLSIKREKPSYIGTIYFDEGAMLELKNNYEDAWINASRI